MHRYGRGLLVVMLFAALLLNLFPWALAAAKSGENEGNLLTSQANSAEGLNTLAFTDSTSEEMHHLRVTGTSGPDTIKATVGQLQDSYNVRYFKGKGAALAFDMMHVTPNKPLTLEVEEIHNRSAQAFAYSVLVNGRETYFRTYQEASAGPNHYFIEVDAAVVGDSHSVHITFQNDGESRVNFSRVWAYSDFANLLKSEGIDRPMTVGLFQPKLNWHDYAADLKLLNDLKSTFGNYSMYNDAIAFDIYYMQWSEEELHQRLDYLMNLSKDTGLQLQLSINSWWGGTPSGPDGQGGYWGDIPYNQVVYDPLNVNGRGNWQLSTPNIWSNTPWLSMNNTDYNEVRAEKIKLLTQYISDKTAEIQAEHGTIPPVVVFTENEPLYWPYFAFNPSPNGAGDFSPEVIAAAAKDGVKLDPTDGLSTEEKQWMVNNLTKYITTASKAMADGYGYDETVINDGQITYPSDQLVENAYTHMFPQPNYPNWDENQAAWETHLVKDIRFGGEWAGEVDPRYMDYIVARGKFADVNSERSSMTDFSLLPQAYAYGADHVTIYNFQNGDQNQIRAVDGKANETSPTPAYDQQLFAYDFRNDGSLAINGPLVEFSGVRREPLGGAYVVCPDNGGSDGGQMAFKVDNKGVPLSTGLTVQLSGRSLTNLNGNVKVEVWAGATHDHLQLVKTLHNFDTEKVDVSDYIDKQSSTAYFQIRLYATTLPSALYSWAEISSVKAFIPWGKTSGHTNGFQYTLQQLRERNMWVSYRADVERLLGQYAAKSGEDDVYRAIKDQYDTNRYVTAYRRLTQALSQTLPAKFLVQGSGTLGKYPLQLQIADAGTKVHTTLFEADQKIKIGFTADADTMVSLTLTHPASAFYRVEDLGGGTYQIVPTAPNQAGAIRVAGNKTVIQLHVTKKAEKQYPAQFDARYYGLAKAPDGYILIQSQDPAIGEDVNYVKLKLSDHVNIRRGVEGATDAQLLSVPLSMLSDGDLLKLTLNDHQEVMGIKAYYGKVSGTIVGIEPISIVGELRDAGIQIRDVNGKEYSFEIGREAVFDSPKATGTNILTAQIDNLGFKIGDQITVDYSPYTYPGRDQRVLRISETYDTLVDENFEEPNEGWRSGLFSATNVKAVPLDSNYHNKVIMPDDAASPGVLVWKLDSATPFSNLAIQYSGRAIMGNPDNQSVKWFVSPDDVNWSQVGMIDPGADEGNFTLKRNILLDSQVRGEKTVYVKCEIHSSFDTWGSLNDVSIKKKAPFRALSAATLSTANSQISPGQIVPVQLSAVYDNGDLVNLTRAKVDYVTDDSNILTIQNGKIQAVSPGTAMITAFVSVDGEFVESNPLSVTVTPN